MAHRVFACLLAWLQCEENSENRPQTDVEIRNNLPNKPEKPRIPHSLPQLLPPIEKLSQPSNSNKNQKSVLKTAGPYVHPRILPIVDSALVDHRKKRKDRHFIDSYWSAKKHSRTRIVDTESLGYFIQYLYKDPQRIVPALLSHMRQSLDKDILDNAEILSELVSAIEKKKSQVPFSTLVRKYNKSDASFTLTAFLNSCSLASTMNIAFFEPCIFEDLLSLVVPKAVNMEILFSAYYGSSVIKPTDTCRRKLYQRVKSITRSLWKYSLTSEITYLRSPVSRDDLNTSQLLELFQSPFLFVVNSPAFLQFATKKIFDNGNARQIYTLLSLNHHPYDIAYIFNKVSRVASMEFGNHSEPNRPRSLKEVFTRLVSNVEGVKIYDYSLYKKYIITQESLGSINLLSEFREKKDQRWRRLHYLRREQPRSLPCPEALFEDTYNKWDLGFAVDEDKTFLCSKIAQCPGIKIWNYQYHRSVFSDFVYKAMCIETLSSMNHKIEHFKGRLRDKKPIDCSIYDFIKQSPQFTYYILNDPYYGRKNYIKLLDCDTTLKSVHQVFQSDFLLFTHITHFAEAVLSKFYLEITKTIQLGSTISMEDFENFVYRSLN